MSVILTARDTLRTRLPQWFRNGNLRNIAYSIGLHMDLITEAAVQAVESRFPLVDYANQDQLGRDRRIRRGLTESNESYAVRLQSWLDTHPLRGGPYGLLQQLYAFYAPNNFRIELLNTSGRRYVMTDDGEIARDDVVWTPPGDHPAKWSRCWLFFFVPTPPSNDGLWGDPGVWGDGGLWGVDMTAEELDLYQLIASENQAKHAEITIVILDESEQFDSYAPGEWPVQISVRT
jgi:hypothetical protein